MVKILLFFLSVLFMSGALYWLNLSAGDVTVIAYGYQIEISIALVLVVTILLATVLFAVISLVFKIVFFPARLISIINEKKDRQMQNEFYEFLDELYFENTENLQKICERIQQSNMPEKLKRPVALLAAKYTNIGSQRSMLQELTSNRITKKQGLAGLVKLSIESEDHSSAENYAIELWSFNKDYNSAKLMIQALIAARKWQKLVEFTDSLRLSYILGNKTKSQVLGHARYMQANEYLQTGDFDLALQSAKLALKLLGDITPVYELIATIYMKKGSHKKAIAMIGKGWEIQPNYTLYSLVMQAKSKLASHDFMEIAQKLLALAPQNYESHIIAARAALDIGQFDLAIKEIGEILGDGHKIRACQLMAEFCIQSHGNSTEALSWLHYAASAENDRVKSVYSFNPALLKVVVEDFISS